jgi:2,4-didehydro-3-deoxy-L-rhamnonate hydrolase
VIGKTAKYITKESALEYVAGYCVINDLSEREYQLERGGQWGKGKGCDTFGPIGPYLVTKDEIPNQQNLKLWLEVDGKRMQNSSTANMIFGVAEIVAYLSQFFTLHPGDVISTGTPQGVGLGFKPPKYLEAGQTMRLGIDGLGEQVQNLISEDLIALVLPRNEQ